MKNKPEQQKTEYTRKELADTLDCSIQAVDKWVSNGLPLERRGKHKVVQLAEAIKYFSHTGRLAKHAHKLMESANPLEIKKTIKKTDSEISDIQGMLDRARFVEIAMFEFVKNAGKDQLIWASQAHRDALEQRRKVEKDIAEIQLSQQAVMPIDEVNRKFVQAGMLVKTQMCTIPGAVAPQCEGKSVVEINEILTREINRVLEVFSDKA